MPSLSNPYDNTGETWPLILDVETTIRNRGEGATGNSPAAVHHPKNTIVIAGFTTTSISHIRVDYDCFADLSEELQYIFIGHNVKFDTMYLMKDRMSGGYGMVLELLKQVQLWDTMVVEYLLTGQQMKMLSLETLAAMYDIPFKKDEKIKEYWDNGIDTTDIPQELLEKYLELDVAVTKNIYVKQYAKAESLGMLPLIKTRMEQLLATALMEFNGMYVDTSVLTYQQKLLENKKIEVMNRLSMLEFYYNSPKELSTWLYGGTKKRIHKVAELDEEGNVKYYKSGLKKGTPRFKKVTEEVRVNPALDDGNLRILKSKDTLDTSEDTLREILDRGTYTFLKPILEDILEFRDLTKQLSTYFEGVGKLIWEHDHCIHGNLNDAVTSTGRLASNSPNLQNLPSYSEE